MTKPHHVHMAFGPNRAFILWIDREPDGTRVPNYRSAGNLPVDLLGRLYGRRHDIERLHSVALGLESSYAVTMKLARGKWDAEWDLLPKYRRLHRILKDAVSRGNATASIGPDDEFYISIDGHRHCVSRNTGLIDEVNGMGLADVKFVALGLDGCGLILDKQNEVISHGPLQASYPTLYRDLPRYMTPHGGRKAVSVALNPFKKDEYFIAFDDGTFCYQSEALGGHCEPPSTPLLAPTTPVAYTRERVPPNSSAMTPADTTERNISILQGRKFDEQMKAWEVMPNLQLESFVGDMVTPDPPNMVWLEPHAVDRPTGETSVIEDTRADTNRGIAYGP